MAASQNTKIEAEKSGADLCYGAEECYEKSTLLLEELGLPRGLLPLKDLTESGYNRETGFVWLKQKSPVQHYNKKLKKTVVYGTEITAYVEKYRMKKMTGVVAKEFLLSVSITEMSLEPSTNKIYFKSSFGIGKAFPAACFQLEDAEEEKDAAAQHQ